VYRARDLKLKREVAIKILPEEFSRDAERVSRFQREAEVLASISHQNIAGIHSLSFDMLVRLTGEVVDRATKLRWRIYETVYLVMRVSNGSRVLWA
jgi:serine/threonine protein kinase